MDENKRTHFLRKFAADMYTEEEHAEFRIWVANATTFELESSMRVYSEIADRNPVKYLPDPHLRKKIEARLDEIDSIEEAVSRPDTTRKFYRIAAAAAIIAVLSAGIYTYVQKPGSRPALVKKARPNINDALPGTKTAILTLADGSNIALDAVVSGRIAQQAGVDVTKNAEGQLIYESVSHADAQGSGTKNLFNTITTPPGGHYQINLPDGSRVWLNAASSLRYPVVFKGNERKVHLTGEAYFEIAHNKLKPFRVESGNQVVEVFGTSFNINSYTNEPVIKTTLLEGSVMVTENQTFKSKFLNPGQEANITRGGSVTLSEGDVMQAVSWKNGNFLFNDMDLVNIMRQLERWYSVEVDYSNVPQTRYNGNISRDENLSKVLRMLEVTGRVKFDIQGNKIKILN